MKRTSFIFFIGLICISTKGLVDDHLNQLTGEPWFGYLSFLDPASNEMIYEDVEMRIRKEFDLSYVFLYQYNNDPSTRMAVRVEYIENDNLFANGKVLNMAEYCPDEIDMVTLQNEMYNDIEVEAYNTYYISEEQYEVIKEIVYPDSPQRIFMNEYCLYRQ